MAGSHEAWTDSFGNDLGMEYLRVEDGYAEAELRIERRHCNPNGVCHGGAVFTLADDSMGAAAFSVAPRGTVPASVQVGAHFARSATAGDTLRVRTRVVYSGRRTAVLQSEVVDQDSRTVALLSASYMFVEPRNRPEGKDSGS